MRIDSRGPGVGQMRPERRRRLRRPLVQRRRFAAPHRSQDHRAWQVLPVQRNRQRDTVLGGGARAVSVGPRVQVRGASSTLFARWITQCLVPAESIAVSSIRASGKRRLVTHREMLITFWPWMAGQLSTAACSVRLGRGRATLPLSCPLDATSGGKDRQSAAQGESQKRTHCHWAKCSIRQRDTSF